MADSAPTDPARGGPIDLPGGPTAVLCLHGLTSTPYELLPVAEALAARGHRVRAPRLVGHGTRPEALQHTRWGDWLATARRAFDALAAEHDKVFVVGLSMGALCGIVVAQERGDRVAGLVAMATPLQLAFKQQAVLALARRLPLADAVPFVPKKGGPDVSDAAIAAAMPNYDRVPLAAASSLLDGQAQARDRVGRLAVPVLVQHGRYDHVAPVHNAHDLMARLHTRHRRLVVYPRWWNILGVDALLVGGARDVVAFVDDPPAFCAAGPTPHPRTESPA